MHGYGKGLRFRLIYTDLVSRFLLPATVVAEIRQAHAFITSLPLLVALETPVVHESEYLGLAVGLGDNFYGYWFDGFLNRSAN